MESPNSFCRVCQTLIDPVTGRCGCPDTPGQEGTVSNTRSVGPSSDASLGQFLPSEFRSTDNHPNEAAAPTATFGPGSPQGLPQSPAGYTILRRLGGGGMGSVYLAAKHGLGGRGPEKLVALKYAAQEDRLAIEALTTSSLRHPNILTVPTWGTGPDGRQYIEMEYAAGGTLAELVAPIDTGERPKPKGHPRPLAPVQAARWMVALCDAVTVAHTHHPHRIIHRDIKPANVVLVGADGYDYQIREPLDNYRDDHLTPAATREALPHDSYTPKLADFGLAKRLGASGLTCGSGALGTLNYMPPEQVRGSSDAESGVDERADVYALGATLHQLLCGHPPFRGITPAKVSELVLTAEPPPLRSLNRAVPAELEAIVWKCLRKDRDERFRSAAELKEELERFLAGEPTRTPLLSRWKRTRLRVRRNRRAIAAVAMLVAVFAAGAMLASPGSARGQKKKTPPDGQPWVQYTPEPKGAEELPKIAAEIQAGGAELIGPSGYPRYTKWPVTEGVLVKSETRDGSYVLQAQGQRLLELLPDPMVDSYELKVILQHLNPTPVGGGLGVYLGFDAVAAKNGKVVYPWVYASYRDEFTLELRNDPTRQHLHGINLFTGTILSAPGMPVEILRRTSLHWLGFKPRPLAPTPTRVITFHVSPEGVRCGWGDGEPNWFGFLSAEDLATDRVAVRRDLQADVGEPTLPVPDWSPRRPIGVWARDGQVSIKSFTIRPLSPAKK